uniref:RxLR effector protein n=1 Tax=Phytophthora agathidicida TaxID=1642459 RepID=A0A7G4WI64_9STRA|nr:PaRXLR75 [Phytophthora agathidicida]
MGVYYILLLTVSSLLALIDAAAIYPTHAGGVTKFDVESSSRMLLPAQSTRSVQRFLRMDKENEGTEERALPYEILHAMNHVDNVVSTGIKESSILQWLENISRWLKYMYWLWKRKTPDEAKKLLGLHHVVDIKSHPNYDTWIGYKQAYNKKFDITD